MRNLSLLILAVPLLLSAVAEAEDAASHSGVEFFEKRIRPQLVKHCYECHSAEADELGGNLLLDTRAGAREGGESGPAVVPENTKRSLLIDALEYKSLEMPPEGQLPEEVINDFRRWIDLGAPDPRDGKPRTAATAAETEKPQALWSLQPLTQPKVPTVKDESWPRDDIDRFVLARLEREGLQPVADAQPLTLLRRLSFDLVGLPPTQQHIQRIEADPAPETFNAIIDELLDSPQFGQRWARHWLDVARFAESAGSSRDVLMPYAWKYRDYVIDAVNEDLPYPQFISEQIAGDLLSAESPAERERLQIATGFLAVGQKSLNGGNVPLDIADDQIDVIGKSVLGLTISCARCHDHKFDPIPTRDYYSLVGIFLSTETLYGGGTKRPKSDQEKSKLYLALGDKDAPNTLAQINRELGQLNKKKQATAKQEQALAKKLPDDWQRRKAAFDERAATAQEDAEGLSKEEQSLLDQIEQFEAAQQSLEQVELQIKELTQQKESVPPLKFAVGLREGKQVADTRVRVRGERNQQGEAAPRGFLQCIAIDQDHVLEAKGLDSIDNTQSGRLQLAAWLTAEDNPLTPRVAVNRIWLHLFGRGIVTTVDNFGLNGSQPTHPELLDHLAQRFVVEGWSTKKLIREIVTSRTYQLSSNFNQTNYDQDPDNTLYWRMNRRRLEAEAIRDAILSASGQLKLQAPPFGSVVAKIGEGEVGRGINTKPLAEPFPYRSVYLPIIRGILPEQLKLFDFPEPSNPQSVREGTNVPAQALFFMNSKFVIEHAEETARQILSSSKRRDERIQQAYVKILSRSPSADEMGRVDEFLNTSLAGEADEKAVQSAWTTVCQSLFASAEFRYIN